MKVSGLNLYHGEKQVLFGINLGIAASRVTALIGPSGSGKSTLLRALNRMHKTAAKARLEGEILLDDQNILGVALTSLRRRVSLVSQKPNLHPRSIYENVAYGLRFNGHNGSVEEAVVRSLERAALWGEVKDQLHKSAHALSGGQQQRLCLARALAVDPEVLLLDEPCAALDPVTGAKIEELLSQLKANCTIVIVAHNMQRVARVSDFTAFLSHGHLVEYSPTPELFAAPANPRTEAYINGRSL